MQTELLTIIQFCKATNVGKTRAYQLIGSGQIEAVKLGKRTLIPRIAMEKFIASLPSYLEKA
jgi:excisionase family DNA binding protein